MNYRVEISKKVAFERLDKALSLLLPQLSRTRLKECILGGHVTCHETVMLDPTTKVQEGQVFDVVLLVDNTSFLEGEDLPLSIIYEDDVLLVVNKPAGLVVHPGSGNKKGTLVHALIHHCRGNLSTFGDETRPGIVHRLDKNTSGLMVVAKTNEAHHFLSKQFSDRSLSRTYWAFVVGRTTETGTLTQTIGRSMRQRQKMTVRHVGGKSAITHYKTLAYYGKNSVVASLVECRLETGRTHQIRVHFAHSGHPVIGDPLYGRSRFHPVLKKILSHDSWPNDRQALHAIQLRFVHPVTQETMAFDASLPEDLQMLKNFLEHLS